MHLFGPYAAKCLPLVAPICRGVYCSALRNHLLPNCTLLRHKRPSHKQGEYIACLKTTKYPPQPRVLFLGLIVFFYTPRHATHSMTT